MSVDELAQIIRTVDGENKLGAGALAEAILAASPPSPAPAESGAVAWKVSGGGVESTLWFSKSSADAVARNHGQTARALYTLPSPAPSASMGRVTVKALEWFSLDTPFYSKAETVVGRYLANRNALLWYLWLPGQSPETHSPIIHDNYDDHRYAAQADYEARILAALDSPPDHGGGEGWQSIETAPTGESVLIWIEGAGPAIGRWFGGRKWSTPGHVFDTRRPTHWRPLPKPPTRIPTQESEDGQWREAER